MEIKVSFIVPVYNVDKFLHKCLTSIQNQTITDWECLLIDDGSTDKSGIICDEFVHKDARFQVFHRTNHGLAASRNYGLEHAIGEYVAFVDSDDWIDEEYLEFLLSHMEPQMDMVQCHAIFEFTNRSLELLKIIPDSIVITGDCRRDYTLASINAQYASKKIGKKLGFFNTAWGKLYRRRTLQIHNLYFTTDLKRHEDTEFFLRFLQKFTKIKICNKILYHYRQSNTSSLVKKLDSLNIEMFIKFLVTLQNFIQKYYPGDREFQEKFNANCCAQIFNLSKNHYFRLPYAQACKGLRLLLNNEIFKKALENYKPEDLMNREVLFVVKCAQLGLYPVLYIFFRLRAWVKHLLFS